MKNLFLARVQHQLSRPYCCGSWVRDLDGHVIMCVLGAGHTGEEHYGYSGIRWAPDRSGVIHVMHPSQKTPGRAIAHRIRAELVCCDIYERVQAGHETLREMQESGHDLCYWGEASARLAEEYDENPGKYEDSETFYAE